MYVIGSEDILYKHILDTCSKVGDEQYVSSLYHQKYCYCWLILLFAGQRSVVQMRCNMHTYHRIPRHWNVQFASKFSLKWNWMLPTKVNRFCHYVWLGVNFNSSLNICQSTGDRMPPIQSTEKTPCSFTSVWNEGHVYTKVRQTHKLSNPGQRWRYISHHHEPSDLIRRATPLTLQ